MSAQGAWSAFERRFAERKIPEIAARAFHHYYRLLEAGETGLIPENAIEPVEEVPTLSSLGRELRALGHEALGKTVQIKLNGGLGTSMGLRKAKSLLRVRGELTFLDIIARASLARGVPLILMNSEATAADSLCALGGHDLERFGLPLHFVQHMVPKVELDSLLPARSPSAPELEWAPFGHGDLYAALVGSGLLQHLLDRGFRYAFVSNADNLGAVVDDLILGHIVQDRIPFLMEVAARSDADRKGGHLARRRADGRLILRELAQCPSEDQIHFQQVRKHRYFNTNSLWMSLPVIAELCEAKGGMLELPLIRNEKTVDPRDPTSTKVVQLETAMGAAIGVVPGAAALHVPRSRFSPVKTCSNLLGVRSDAFVLTDDSRVILSPQRDTVPNVVLDDAHYRLIDQLDARFAEGPVSLLECDHFEVVGDVRFGRGVRARGRVLVRNEAKEPRQISDGAVLEGEVVL